MPVGTFCTFRGGPRPAQAAEVPEERRLPDIPPPRHLSEHIDKAHRRPGDTRRRISVSPGQSWMKPTTTATGRPDHSIEQLSRQFRPNEEGAAPPFRDRHGSVKIRMKTLALYTGKLCIESRQRDASVSATMVRLTSTEQIVGQSGKIGD
jgi:hypothetical protein